jgi:uncharacterized integral membrane protein
MRSATGQEVDMVFVYLLMALFGAAAVAFAFQNPEPVRLSFLGWKTTAMPLSFVLLMSAFVGVVVASISAFAEKFQLQRRVRSLERELAAMAAESWPPTALREPVREPFRPIMREPVREPVREPIRDGIREPVRDPMRDRLTPASVPPPEPACEPVSQASASRATVTRAEMVRPPI